MISARPVLCALCALSAFWMYRILPLLGINDTVVPEALTRRHVSDNESAFHLGSVLPIDIMIE